MHNIEMHEMTEAFFPCWTAAGIHLSKQVDGGIQSWLRAHPYPPFLENLSFRLGNQLFFVRIEDVDGKAQGPGTLRGLAAAARDANGHACILPMKKKLFGGSWVANMPGWGLLNADTRKPIWFVGKTRRPEWVVVRSAKFPASNANRPTNWAAIADGCARLSTTGHFASVAVVSVNQPFASSEEAPVPLWRGHGMHVRFDGLE